MARATDPRYEGVVGGFVVPALTGISASGLLVAANAVGADGSVAAFFVLVGGAALLGVIIGNPGNAAVLLVGAVAPAVLLIAIEPHHACVDRVAPFVFINIGAGLGLMFIGSMVGIMAARAAGIQPVRRRIAVAILAGTALLASAGWLAFGLYLARELPC